MALLVEAEFPELVGEPRGTGSERAVPGTRGARAVSGFGPSRTRVVVPPTTRVAADASQPVAGPLRRDKTRDGSDTRALLVAPFDAIPHESIESALQLFECLDALTYGGAEKSDRFIDEKIEECCKWCV